MDPSVTWCAIAEAVKNDEWEEAVEHAQTLLDWLLKEGFPPVITGTVEFDRIAATRTCEAIVAWEV